MASTYDKCVIVEPTLYFEKILEILYFLFIYLYLFTYFQKKLSRQI